MCGSVICTECGARICSSHTEEDLEGLCDACISRATTPHHYDDE